MTQENYDKATKILAEINVLKAYRCAMEDDNYFLTFHFGRVDGKDYRGRPNFNETERLKLVSAGFKEFVKETHTKLEKAINDRIDSLEAEMKAL